LLVDATLHAENFLLLSEYTSDFFSAGSNEDHC